MNNRWLWIVWLIVVLVLVIVSPLDVDAIEEVDPQGEVVEYMFLYWNPINNSITLSEPTLWFTEQEDVTLKSELVHATAFLLQDQGAGIVDYLNLFGISGFELVQTSDILVGTSAHRIIFIFVAPVDIPGDEELAGGT